MLGFLFKGVYCRLMGVRPNVPLLLFFDFDLVRKCGWVVEKTYNIVSSLMSNDLLKTLNGL